MWWSHFDVVRLEVCVCVCTCRPQHQQCNRCICYAGCHNASLDILTTPCHSCCIPSIMRELVSETGDSRWPGQLTLLAADGVFCQLLVWQFSNIVYLSIHYTLLCTTYQFVDRNGSSRCNHYCLLCTYRLLFIIYIITTNHTIGWFCS